MTKLIDFTPSDEQGLVSRILVNIHQALDQENAGQNGKDSLNVIKKKKHQETLVAQTPGIRHSHVSPGAAPKPEHERSGDRLNSGFSNYSRPLTGVRTEMEVDLLYEKRRKSKSRLFLVIVIATTAFIALALLLSNRSFH